MRIEFTAHALKRMEEREIGRDEIALVLTDPDEELPVKFGRRAAFRYFQETGLVVIYQQRPNKVVEVVTAVWADRRRLMRYGFTRV